MSELADALGRGVNVTLGDKILCVEPLDFNDLVDLEEYSGINADDLDMTVFLVSSRNKRFFLWLVLRKADPSLTAEQREAGEYTMTEAQAGRLLKFGSTAEQWALVHAALGLSGLKNEETAPEEDADPKPQPGKPARKKAQSASAPAA